MSEAFASLAETNRGALLDQHAQLRHTLLLTQQSRDAYFDLLMEHVLSTSSSKGQQRTLCVKDGREMWGATTDKEDIEDIEDIESACVVVDAWQDQMERVEEDLAEISDTLYPMRRGDDLTDLNLKL